MSNAGTTAGERRVLAEAPSGQMVDLTDLPAEERVVSPDVIRRLCVGSDTAEVDPRGIRIKGARIVEEFDLSFCTVPHPLRFVATEFGATPFLSRADLPGLWIEDCSLPGLEAYGIRTGDFRLQSSEVTGEVRLVNATIGGVLVFSSATFTNESGTALSADGAEVSGGVFLDYGFKASGEVRFSNAKIGGALVCSDATFTNEGGEALSAVGAEIGDATFLDYGFKADGEVRLSNAKLGGPLVCSGATLTNEGGDALSAEGTEIRGSVFFEDGFGARGAVRLINTQITGQLVCVGATFVKSGGVALTARDATVSTALIFRNVDVTGGVDLFRATATTLDDDLGQADHPLGSWRDVQPLILDTFAYARFGPEAKWDAKLRQRWLKQTSGFQQGAWQELIAAYRAQGRDDEVTSTSISMHNVRASRAGLPWYRRVGRRILRVVVGHGYRPWYAGIWATGIVILFALGVWHWSEMFVPENDGVTGAPQPVAYAADVFLPIIDFGQAGNWAPSDWIRWVEWSVIVLGWSLSTLFVAGFTRIARSA
jgi:hypothetical protein